MANNYTEFSERFELKGADVAAVKAWVVAATEEIELDEADTPKENDVWTGAPDHPLAPWRDAERDYNAPFAVEGPTTYAFYVMADEARGSSIEHAVAFVQAFWAKFGAGGEVGSFEWAERCDRMRPGEFGGGCVVFTKDEELWRNTGTQVHLYTKRLTGTKSRWRKDWAVITDTDAGIEVTTYRGEADAYRVAAGIVADWMKGGRYEEEDRVKIQKAYAEGSYTDVMTRWTEICNTDSGNDARVYVSSCKRYSSVAQPGALRVLAGL